MQTYADKRAAEQLAHKNDIEALIASGRVRVTRCPDGARQWHDHWDPVRR